MVRWIRRRRSDYLSCVTDKQIWFCKIFEIQYWKDPINIDLSIGWQLLAQAWNGWRNTCFHWLLRRTPRVLVEKRLTNLYIPRSLYSSHPSTRCRQFILQKSSCHWLEMDPRKTQDQERKRLKRTMEFMTFHKIILRILLIASGSGVVLATT